MAEATRRPAAKEYTATLEAYLSSAGEFALERAYEIGRHAANGGMSLLQFAELHHAALRALAGAPGASVEEILTRGEQFFSEGLSAFEMILRGHRASARLLGLSDGSTRQNGELGRARAQLKSVLDATQALVFLRDIDGRFLFVNGTFERLFGLAETRVLGRTAQELASSLDLLGADGQAAAALTLLRRDDALAFASQLPIESECTCSGADGPHRYRMLDLPLLDPSEGVYAVCTIASDATREQRAGQAIALAKEATDAASRQLESFSRALADDLLAPLRSIDGFSQALLDDCGAALDAQSKAYLCNVRQSAQRMATLIDSLLAMAKFSRGELRSNDVDLTALARDVAAQLRQTEPERRVSFEIQSGLRAQGDARLFGAVLQNLLGNSWKFTRPREHAEIVVGQDSQQGMNVYFVKDNGTGFDMAHSDKLFSVFETLHSRREFAGNGVGLATVQRIVTRHGGRVWAEASVDRGATFYFTIGEQLS
jgi:signal transduction histidine kinase